MLAEPANALALLYCTEFSGVPGVAAAAVVHVGKPPADTDNTWPVVPMLKKAVVSAADWYGTAPTAPFLRFVDAVAVPVVFWLNVGHVKVPVEKSPDAGVANTAPVFKSSAKRAFAAVVAVAALPVVFWLNVGTVPVRPEYGTLKAVVATGGTAGGADVQSVPSDVKSCPATPGVGNVVDADAVVCVVLSGNTIPRLLICVVI
jgi:hypothetical protein